MDNLVGTLCRIEYKEDNNTRLVLVLGYWYEGIRKLLSSRLLDASLSLNLYKDRVKELNNCFETLENKFYWDNVAIYACYIVKGELSLDKPLKDSDISTLTYKELSFYLKRKVKVLNLCDMKQWLLKSELLGVYTNSSRIMSKEECLKAFINTESILDLDTYLCKYLQNNYKIGQIKDRGIVIRRCDVTYQVWYVKNNYRYDDINKVGYKLKVFKEKDKLDMLLYIEDLINNQSKIINCIKKVDNYKHNPFDLILNKTVLLKVV